MKKSWIGITLGMIAGILDVIPMILQKLTWDANLGAFSMWILSGFFISNIEINLHPALKGIFISILLLIPSAFLIGWNAPLTLVPILGITVVLGGFLGYTISLANEKLNSI